MPNPDTSHRILIAAFLLIALAIGGLGLMIGGHLGGIAGGTLAGQANRFGQR